MPDPVVLKEPKAHIIKQCHPLLHAENTMDALPREGSTINGCVNKQVFPRLRIQDIPDSGVGKGKTE